MRKRICISRVIGILLTALLLLTVLPAQTLATDGSRTYEFALTVNGRESATVQKGDVLTVSLTLNRKNPVGSNVIYAVQDEIQYDASFFEIVTEGGIFAENIETTDISLQGNLRAFYVNFVSFQGGTEWETNKMLAVFQVKVIGDGGASTLTNTNNLVSTKDGQDSFSVSQKDFTAYMSTECSVTFDPQNGEEPTQYTVRLGETIPEPKTPEKAGYLFTGWYTDISLSEPWDFETDTVSGNLTLYAGWHPAGETETGSETDPVSEDTAETEQNTPDDDTRSPDTSDSLPDFLLYGGIMILLAMAMLTTTLIRARLRQKYQGKHQIPRKK